MSVVPSIKPRNDLVALLCEKEATIQAQNVSTRWMDSDPGHVMKFYRIETEQGAHCGAWPLNLRFPIGSSGRLHGI